jgi:hypothetical protein
MRSFDPRTPIQVGDGPGHGDDPPPNIRVRAQFPQRRPQQFAGHVVQVERSVIGLGSDPLPHFSQGYSPPTALACKATYHPFKPKTRICTPRQFRGPCPRTSAGGFLLFRLQQRMENSSTLPSFCHFQPADSRTGWTTRRFGRDRQNHVGQNDGGTLVHVSPWAALGPRP